MSVHTRDRLVLAMLLLALKGLLLALWGPAILPDTGGYTAYADLILSGRINEVDLTQSAILIPLFRVIGYPAVVAAAKLLGGEGWPWLLMAVQIVVSVAATLMVHTTARAFGLGRVLALAVAVAAATSLPLVLDQAILTDSLYTSLMILAYCLVIQATLLGKPQTVWRMLAAGMLVALAFLIREATTYLAAGLAPLAALAVFGARAQRRRLVMAVALTGVFLLPLAGAQQVYREWNRARVGVPAITTGGQTNMLFAVSKAARMDPSVFDGDTVVDRTARAVFQTYEFFEVILVNEALFKQHGMNALDITAATQATYFAAWRNHFTAMLQVPLGHIRSNQLQLTVRPIESIRELILWTQHDDNGFARWRSVREGQWWMAPVVVVDGLGKAISAVIFLAFALLTPWRLLRGDGFTPANAAAAGLWLLYFAVFGIYALVHLETRYMAAVVPASLIVGVANLVWAQEQWKRHRRARPNGL